MLALRFRLVSHKRMTPMFVWHQSQPSFGLKSFGHHIGKIEFLRSLWGHITLIQILVLHKQRVGCMQYNVARIKGEFDLIKSENLRKWVKFRTWKSLLAIILSHCTCFIYYKLGHAFLSFSSCYYCALIIFITAGCLETISNVAYNISDPSNDKSPEKKVLLATKIWSVYFATCQMNLFVCLQHFYCENNKGLLFFRCNGNEVIVVEAINRKYPHTVHLVRK